VLFDLFRQPRSFPQVFGVVLWFSSPPVLRALSGQSSLPLVRPSFSHGTHFSRSPQSPVDDSLPSIVFSSGYPFRHWSQCKRRDIEVSGNVPPIRHFLSALLENESCPHIDTLPFSLPSALRFFNPRFGACTRFFIKGEWAH